MEELKNRVIDFMLEANSANCCNKLLSKDELSGFISYWTEKNPNGRKMRFEKEKTFDIHKRLARWKRNIETNFGKNAIKNTFDIRII